MMMNSRNRRILAAGSMMLAAVFVVAGLLWE
jgi:hypothetical protein